MFLDGLGALIGNKVEFAKWNTQGVSVTPPVSCDAAAKASRSAAVVPAPVASLSDHGDATWLLEQNGFRIGQNLVRKGTS